MQHHPLAYTAQQVAASEHLPGKRLAKVVVVLADGRVALVVVPAHRRVDVARLGGVLGAQEVRLAHEEEFAGAFPDCAIGAMPPFGNLYGFPVYVDGELATQDNVVFQAGTHTDTMSLKYADFDRLVRPTVAELAYHP